MNSKLFKHYYQNNDYETLKGYTVVAIDGSVGEAPYTDNSACLLYTSVSCFQMLNKKKAPYVIEIEKKQ